MRNDFAAFILTHGRPDKVLTYNSLRKAGYTGKIYLIVDDLDKTIDRYKEIYGNQVIVFDKVAISRTFDTADNFDDMRAIVYARNACFEIAKDLGLKYFIELDDDYNNFLWKQSTEGYKEKIMRYGLDNIFNSFIEFLETTKCNTICMAQNGDFIGGEFSAFAKKIQLKRKAMNSFVCATDRPFQFIGRINEDVNTYTRMGSVGNLFFTNNQVALHQLQTQSNSGGMTDLYLSSGTYVKSFYTVMFIPSAVKIGLMGQLEKRLHHQITWRNCVPQIVSESVKKRKLLEL